MNSPGVHGSAYSAPHGQHGHRAELWRSSVETVCNSASVAGSRHAGAAAPMCMAKRGYTARDEERPYTAGPVHTERLSTILNWQPWTERFVVTVEVSEHLFYLSACPCDPAFFYLSILPGTPWRQPTSPRPSKEQSPRHGGAEVVGRLFLIETTEEEHRSDPEALCELRRFWFVGQPHRGSALLRRILPAAGALAGQRVQDPSEAPKRGPPAELLDHHRLHTHDHQPRGYQVREAFVEDCSLPNAQVESQAHG